MAEPESEKRATNPLGIILALGAAGLLLVILFFRSSPSTDVPAEQGQMAAALVSTMMTNGVLVDYDCAKSSAWVNRAVWEKSNAEQKRNMTISLATACDAQHAGYHISIIDYESRLEIASFDGKQLTFAK